MLKITLTKKGGTTCLRLEGNLQGPWVDELRSMTTPAALPTARCELDLAGVRFVDANGLALLRELADRGCAVINRSGFVAELMRP